MCKAYLLGMCPGELFAGTKEADTGGCSGAHDPRLRRAYVVAAATTDFGWDRDLERALEALAARADKLIARSRERVAEEAAAEGCPPPPAIDIDGAPELAALSSVLEAAAAAGAAAAERGDLERAAAAEEEVEALRRERAQATAALLQARAAADDRAGAPSARQRMRYCSVCGAFVSLSDSRDRIADHFGGRSHLGYVALRQKIRHIREWRRAARVLGGQESSPAALALWAVQFPAGSPGAIAATSAASSREAAASAREAAAVASAAAGGGGRPAQQLYGGGGYVGGGYSGGGGGGGYGGGGG